MVGGRYAHLHHRMTLPDIVSREEWTGARVALLEGAGLTTDRR
jgi:hypothetical protein